MKKLICSLSMLLFFIFFILYPDAVKAGAGAGLSLWYQSVLPVLFPFLILSNLILYSGSLTLVLRPLFLIGRYIPFFNPWIIYPICFGLFCGFPMGAKVTAELIEQGRLTKQEGNLLLPFVSQASPIFLTGYVGTWILEHSIPFHTILLLIYVPAFLLFLIDWLFSSYFRKCFPTRSLGCRTVKNPSSFQSFSSHAGPSSGFEQAAWDAFSVIVTIGIYMMLFSVGARICSLVLPDHPGFQVCLSFLEFSSGLASVRHFSFLTPKLKRGLLFALTSFGGFCTAAQVRSVTKKTDISFLRYLFWKFLCSFIVFYLACRI